MLRVRHHVPHRGEPDAGNDRVARAVDELVDLARREASVARDPRILHEAPLVPRHDAARRQAAVALGQHVVRILRIGDGIRPVAAMAERQGEAELVHRPVAAHQALDRAAAVRRDGRVQTQGAAARRHVELPAHPDERETEPQRKRVAELGLGREVRAPRGPREVRQHRLAAAIGDLQKRDRAIARHRLRAQDHEIRGRGDASARVPRGARQVDDDGVGGVGRIEREFHHADQLFVGACRPEGAPAENVLTRLDGEPTDDRRGRRRHHQRQEEGSQQRGDETARRHVRRSI